ncbi:MAG: hypothetical protein LBS74_09455 [Oscillospiraceae bacterium]|nr:hypothetical protein [Oscillospiraceae bacterium]
MRSGFFNSNIIGTDEAGMPLFDRAEQADFFARYFASFVKNGVLADSFVLSHNNLSLNISGGAGFVNGYFAWENADTQFSLNSAYGKAYRVALQLNLAERQIALKLLSSANPPAPERSGDIYELILYTINVAQGQAELAEEDITDNRQDSYLCGLLGLDNPKIYSGSEEPDDFFGEDGDIYIQY